MPSTQGRIHRRCRRPSARTPRRHIVNRSIDSLHIKSILVPSRQLRWCHTAISRRIFNVFDMQIIEHPAAPLMSSVHRADCASGVTVMESKKPQPYLYGKHHSTSFSRGWLLTRSLRSRRTEGFPPDSSFSRSRSGNSQAARRPPAWLFQTSQSTMSSLFAMPTRQSPSAD